MTKPECSPKNNPKYCSKDDYTLRDDNLENDSSDLLIDKKKSLFENNL